MKKLMITVALGLLTGIGFSQDETSATSKGKILVETNTGFGAAHASNTGFYLSSVDGNTSYNLGAEGGYFIKDNLALKLGLGFGAANEATTTSFKIGVKYYLKEKIPLQADFSGVSVEGNGVSYFGLQGGYAWFITDNISIEPGLRFNLPTNDDFKTVTQLNIGFAIYF